MVEILRKDRDSRHTRAVRASLLAAVIALSLSLEAAQAQQPVVYFTRFASEAPFVDPVYQQGEAFAVVAIFLHRQGILSQNAVVHYWTEDGTAIAGEDYEAVNASFTFTAPAIPNLRDSTIIDVPLIGDDVPEGDETFLFHIEVTGGAVLQGAGTAEIVISDDDGAVGAPVVSFDNTGPLSRNLRGQWIFPGPLCPRQERCTAQVPLRVSGTFDNAVEVRVTVSGISPDEETIRIQPGETGFVPVAGYSNRKLGDPSDSRTVEIVSAAGNAVIGEPARVRVVFGVRSGLSADQAGEVECPYCGGLVWAWFAGFLAECPTQCHVDCSVGGPTPRQNGSVDVLRTFRDEVMSQSPAGRYYTRLYNGISAEIGEALFASPGLIFDTLDAEDAWVAGLEALTQGQGDSAVITQAMVDDLLEILDGLKASGSPALRALIEMEEKRLDLADLAGMSFDEFEDDAERQGGGFACDEDANTLCLNDGRFWIQVRWTNFRGKSGVARAEALSGDTGMFWFFEPENIELVIKVLDGRGSNGNFWVFYGALTNVEFTLTVMDTETGVVKTYHNPLRQFASVGDNEAFPPVDEVAVGTDSTSGGVVESVASAAWHGARSRFGRWLDSVWPSRLPVSALEPLPRTDPPGTDLAGAELPPVDLVGRADCTPSTTALCLNEERFRIEVEWRDFRGRTGTGRAVPLTADTGYFWFFDDTNVELMVKVLDGRGSTGHFWVFYGALTNVEFTLTVTDTETGRFKSYFNPLRTFASVGDTEALPGN